MAKTTKELNRALTAANTDKQKYFPMSINLADGEVIDEPFIFFEIDEVKCFEVIESEYNFDLFRIRRIDFNKFYCERTKVNFAAGEDEVIWKARVLNGEEVSPILLNWRTNSVTISYYQQAMKSLIRTITEAPLKGEAFTKNKIKQ